MTLSPHITANMSRVSTHHVHTQTLLEMAADKKLSKNSRLKIRKYMRQIMEWRKQGEVLELSHVLPELLYVVLGAFSCAN